MRIIQPNSPALTQTPLTLIATKRQTFANALSLLQRHPLETPVRMYAASAGCDLEYND